MNSGDAHQKYSAGGALAAYLVLGGFLYHRSILVMMRLWQGESSSYCLFVPPVVAYLCWQKRAALAAAPSAPSWWGLILLVPSLILYSLGELGGEYYCIFLSSWLLVVSLCWLHLGPKKVKALRFPLAFALVMFPLPSVVFNNASLQLKLLSSRLGVWIVRLVRMEVYREGNIIDLGFTRLQVVDACSGLRYLIPLLILGALLAHFSRLRFWPGALLVASTVPISVIANSLRIALTAFLYPYLGLQAAEGGFHDFSGWLIFMVSLALLVAEIWLLRKLPPKPQSGIEAFEAGKTAPAAAPSPASRRRNMGLFCVASSILVATLLLSHSLQQRPRVPLAKPLAQFPLEVQGWRGSRSSMEQSYLETLKLSDYLLADYHDETGGLINVYIAYNDSQRKGASTHSPASCLPGSGWVFEESGGVRLAATSPIGAELRVNRALVQKGGQRMLMYYWFPQRGRVLTSMSQLKFYVFWDGLTRGRTDGAMVRLMTPVLAADRTEQAEGRLAAFASIMLPLLPKFIPN